MSVSLFKGYTQRLIGDANNDIDRNVTHFNRMTEGLYLMRTLQQEGYILPVCKYINNIRSDVIGGMPILTDGISSHPRYDYAEKVGNQLKLVNTLTIPTAIAGGIVSITNIMRSLRVPRYNVMDQGNLSDLIASESAKVLYMYKEEKACGLILQVNKACVLETEHIDYSFDFISDGEIYTDFIATLKEK